MSIINLNKPALAARADSVAIILSKRSLPRPPIVRVAAALDISGSAKGLYESGIIQETHDRMLGIAMKFDDNGEIDTWTFTDTFDRLPTATPENYGAYITEEVMKNASVRKWGATEYAPVMTDIVNFFFAAAAPDANDKPGFFRRLFGAPQNDVTVANAAPANNMPVWVLFVTDGQNPAFDRARVWKLLRETQKFPIYWSLIGVGNPDEFAFLEEVAEQLPNAGFLHLESLDISDQAIYEQLITEEFCDWVRGK
ncbi:VWA domain-containing protein [Caballeronia sp. LP006]|uniref:VWA domain-containing protein n=1 Tax=unclassified Caballeronia TaxID=2646786 RepID=UPI00285DDBAD|nr:MULTISPECIES: VWA domain-containing protein [unclassified Caballeronia]MDR5773799.1 VWA domain-containing protein [Caballeronia sp. LZ002]MDR5827363.1 VWA domain-containing protein [Caballeronia sp. LP006]MDR5849234.1 VWA domain-containing protein [Caballeronia sp. LZ003]